MERSPLSSFEREPQVVLHVLTHVTAFGQIELRDALVAALRVLARVRGAEHVVFVISPSVRTEKSRPSNGCCSVALTGPVGVRAQNPARVLR